jgi:hypothetical protein
MLEFDGDTLLIGKLKTISTETEIKELLDAYDPEVSHYQAAHSQGCCRTPLQST